MKSNKLIDLSTKISSRMISIPKKEHIKTQLEEVSTLKKEGIKRTMLHCSCHCGTHMDAPNHILHSKISIDKISLNHFIGTAVKIKSIAKPNQTIEKIGGVFSSKHLDFLVLDTGWHKHWGLNDYYTNYPSLSKKFVSIICRLPINGIITDLPSLDASGDDSFKNHKQIFRSNKIVIESAINLDQLPPMKLFKIYAFPLRLVGSEASPCRVIASI